MRMKRNITSLTLLFLLLIGSVFSVESFAAVWNMGNSPKTTFSDGDYICLERSSNWTNGTGAYLADIIGGNSVSTSATDERIVLKLIATTETGWSTIPAFYLQNVSTQRYLTSNANGTFTAEKSKAVAYSIISKGNTSGLSFYSSGKGTYTDLFVGCNASDDCVALLHTNGTECYYRYMDDNSGAIGDYWYTFGWFAYEMTEEENPRQEFFDLYQSYTNESLVYGDNPGYTPTAAAEVYMNVLKRCDTLLAETHTNEEYRTYIQELKEAHAAYTTAQTNPVSEGYYYIVNGYAEWSKSRGHYLAMSAQDGDTDSKASFVAPIDSTSGQYIWKITKNSDETWYVKNVKTGAYLGANNANNATLLTSKESAINITELTEAQFHIQCGDVTYFRDSGSDGYCINYNTGSGSGNKGDAWYLWKITDENFIAQVEDEAAKDNLRRDYQTLLSDANSKYSTLYSFTSPALIEESQITSNYKESVEGSYAALLDENTDTYFHSAYTVSAKEYHYLQVDLGQKALKDIVIKTEARHDNNSNRPSDIIISATNDTINGGTWQEVTELTGIPGDEDTKGYTSPIISADKAYRYYRFTVTKTNTGEIASSTSPYPYFTFSEFQIYAPDSSSSEAAAQMGQVVPNLKAAIDTANSKLRTSGYVITQSDYDALDNAYKAFLAQYVDTTNIRSALDESYALLERAVEGTELGQYEEGSKNKFRTALDSISGLSLVGLNRAAYDQILDSIQAARQRFNAALHFMNTNEWYYIVNAESETNEDSHYNNALSIKTDGSNELLWGGADSNGNLEESIKESPRFMWRAIEMENKTYALQNMATGVYLGAYPGEGRKYQTSTTPIAYSISVGENSFTLVPASEKDALPLCATTSNAIIGKAYEKGNATNWKFISPESDLEYVSASYNINSAYAICYPFAFTNDPDVTGATVYTVCGKVLGDDNKITALKLHEISDVAAGQPVIIIIGDREAYDAQNTEIVEFYMTTGKLNEAVFENTPQKANGLIGTYNYYYNIPEGMGLIENNVFHSTQTGEFCGENTAIIDPSNIQDTDESTDYTLLLDQGVLNKIKVSTADSAYGNIYDITGVLIKKNANLATATKDLKPGLYIIGKKKVLVK